jgi:sulfane dehydrogenase subunit SoxC
VISGLVDRPLQFSIDELKRLPSVTRLHYIECVANGTHPKGKTVDDMHGMMSNSEWTGVLLSVLLKEAGVKTGANWVLGEGADANENRHQLPDGESHGRRTGGIRPER